MSKRIKTGFLGQNSGRKSAERRRVAHNGAQAGVWCAMFRPRRGTFYVPLAAQRGRHGQRAARTGAVRCASRPSHMRAALPDERGNLS